MHAAAVNFTDVLLVANAYQVQVPVPFVPGSELSGEVLAVGPDVQGITKGNRIFGTAARGAFAERALLAVGQVTKMPERAGFTEAAAFGVAYRTAYHALRSVAEVTVGDWRSCPAPPGASGSRPLMSPASSERASWRRRPARRS